MVRFVLRRTQGGTGKRPAIGAVRGIRSDMQNPCPQLGRGYRVHHARAFLTIIAR